MKSKEKRKIEKMTLENKRKFNSEKTKCVSARMIDSRQKVRSNEQ